MPIADVNVQSRATMGVRLMRVPDGVRVISIALTSAIEEDAVEGVVESIVEDAVEESVVESGIVESAVEDAELEPDAID
jgi:hypothetical protein